METRRAIEMGSPTDLREYIQMLERFGELRRVRAEVSCNLEIGAMSRLVCERRGPSPLYENIKDHPGHRLAAVLLGPSKPHLHARTSIALGLDKSTPAGELIDIARDRFRSPIEPVVVSKDRAPCKEVIVPAAEADLLKFPVPWTKNIDVGPYLGTWDIVITKDADSDWVNWGTYRCMLVDQKHFAVLLLSNAQHGGQMLRKYEAMNKPMPFALVIGADPLCHLAAITPSAQGMNEATLAGALHGRPVQLVKCETNDLYVPATAEIVIEAEVRPGEKVPEGPYGEYTGHRGGPGLAPLARVTCITHRKNPIFTLANMGKPWDDYVTCTGPLMSALVKNELEDHGVDVKGVYHYPVDIPVISLKPAPGAVAKSMGVILSQPRYAASGKLVFVDEDVDPTNLEDVWWAIASRLHPDRCTSVPGASVFAFNPWFAPEERERHAAPFLVMDATFPHYWSEEYRKIHTVVSDFKYGFSDEVKEKVLARWGEYGYTDV